jgi:hypothetical protein
MADVEYKLIVYFPYVGINFRHTGSHLIARWQSGIYPGKIEKKNTSKFDSFSKFTVLVENKI